MKNRKRKFECYSFYDRTGIEAHLRHMAAKGWLIEKISNQYWTYQKIEPADICFSVSYYAKASDFDPQPREGQQTYIDYCEQTGWNLACRWFQMQVFYNTDPHATPIHTDPVLEVEAIHKGCKSNFLKSYLVLAMISLVFSVLALSSLLGDFLLYLASPVKLTCAVCVLLLFTLCLVDLISYYRWLHRARKAAENDDFMETPSTSGFQKGILWICGLSFSWWLVNVLFSKNIVLAWSAFGIIGCIIILQLLVPALKDWMKRKNVSKGANIVLTLAACVILSFVLVGGVVSVGVHCITQTGPNPVYLRDNLKATDLMESDNIPAIFYREKHDESILIARHEVEPMLHHSSGEDGKPTPYLAYTQITVKFSPIQNFCAGVLRWNMKTDRMWRGEVLKENASRWGADAAWKLHVDGTDPQYLLQYGNVLVRLQLDWEPDPSQCAAVGTFFKSTADNR